MKPRFHLPHFAAAASLFALPAAATTTWTGATNGSWATATNWTGTPPDNVTAQSIVFDSTSTANLTQTLNASYTVTGITLTNPTGAVTVNNGTGTGNTLTIGSGGIDLSAASQNLTLSANLLIGANQTWTVNGGRTLSGIAGASTSSGSGTGDINMLQSGTGTATIVFNQNGNTGSGQTGWSNYSGNITINSNVKVQSQGNAAAAFGSGTITLAGGQVAQNLGNWTWGNTINVTAASVIGSDSSNGLGRTLKLLGDLTSTNSSGLTFTNNVTGGTRNDNVGFILAGANASSHTTTTISANSRVRVGGNATATVAGDGLGAGNRGSLGTGDVTLSASTSELAFTRTDAHTVANKITGSGTVVIGGNTAAMAGTITQVVTLSGASDYTGATRVSRSRLNLTGSLTSAITVDNLGSVSGTGSTTGLLTLGSGGGGHIALAGGATTSSFTSNGATFGGSNLVTFLSTPLAATEYVVLNYGAGAVTNSENLSAAYRGSLTNDLPNQRFLFTLGSIAETRTWNTTTGIWAVNSGTNFSEGDQRFFHEDHVLFGNIASDSTVTLSGPIVPGSVTVNHEANRYTFAGTAIDGTASLIKSGAGTLELSAANSYSGGTTLNAGTLQIGHNSGLGTGSLTINGGSLTTGALERQLANDIVLAGDAIFTGTANNQGMRLNGIISGNGGITKEGTGRVTLANDANSYIGDTIINGGILATSLNALASSGSVTITSGGSLAIGSNGTTHINNLSGVTGALIRSDFNILAGDAARILSVNQTVDGEFGGSFSQGGNRPISLIKEGSATLTLTGTGTYTGATTVNAGTLKIGGDGLLGSATYAGAITNSATLHFDSTANQTLSGSLSGSGVLLKSGTGTLILTNNNDYQGSITITEGTLQVGNNSGAGFIGNSATITNNAAMVWHRSNDTNVGNVISGTGTLTKLGGAILSLNGVSDYTGATTVSAGTLLVNGSLGATATTVESGATLAGGGSIGGPVSILDGGTLAPGNSISSFAVGNLSMIAGSTFNFGAQDASAIGADLLVAGTLNLAAVNLGLSGADLASAAWSPGDKLTLISYTGSAISSGFSGYADNTAYSFGANEWLFRYADTTPGNNFASEATGSHFVTLTVIPEPGTALLGGLGLLALLRRRRH